MNKENLKLLIGLIVSLIVLAYGIALAIYNGKSFDEDMSERAIASAQITCVPLRNQETRQYWANGKLQCEIIEDRRH